MGGEIGQESEWAESRELDWWLLDHPEHLGVHRLMKDLNRVYADSPAIWSRDHESDSFEWIDANDAGRNVFSFIRRGVSTGSTSERSTLVCVSNFAAVPHSDFRLGLPAAGEWREAVNTDAATYTGSGVGNLGVVTAVEGGDAGAFRSVAVLLIAVRLIEGVAGEASLQGSAEAEQIRRGHRFVRLRRKQLARADRFSGRRHVIDVRRLDRAFGKRPGGIPEARFLIEPVAGGNAKRRAPFRAEGVKRGLRNLRRGETGGVVQSQRRKELFLHQGRHRRAGHLFDHPAQDHDIRMRVAPVDARLEMHRGS